MKHILFDIISLQDYHNGGEEYVRAVLKALLNYNDIEIIGLYDSKLKFLDDDYSTFSNRFKLIDIQSKPIATIISEENIDTFFIGIGQRYSSYNLNDINCRTICVVHDIGNIEFSQNKIHYLFPKSLKRFINLLLDYWLTDCKYSFSTRISRAYKPLISFLKRKNVELITVSNYTANSLKFYFPELNSKTIKVLYPPIKDYIRKDIFDNHILKNFINEGKPYLLLLNINRENKNGSIVLDAFRRIKLDHPEIRLVVTGASKEEYDGDILYLTYVSNSDMENLYKEAWALVYPSFTEGFGYPPIEAMKYGTPVLSANVCSMPEVLGKAAIYFSPFYQNDLYCQIKSLLNCGKQYYYNISQEHSRLIAKRQIEDFNKLISIVVNI